jgi:hypothetical protein
MNAPKIERGTFFVIRTDDSGETIKQKPTIALITKVIGCEVTDSVRLQNDIVMIVADGGWKIDVVDHGTGLITLKPAPARKPVNALATELYWSVCHPGTTHQIFGDVALVRDSDFA